jgi:hypothetical protein
MQEEFLKWGIMHMHKGERSKKGLNEDKLQEYKGVRCKKIGLL